MKSHDTTLDPRDMRFLVIGATGLLGRQVVRELAGRQWPVRGLRRWDEEARGLQFSGVELVVGDVLDRPSFEEAIAGCNAAIYCAAPSPGRSRKDVMVRSVEGIRRVLEACREHGLDRLVVTSSASTMGNLGPGQLATEEDHYLPGSSDDPFADAKYAVELECYRYVADGFPVVILNPTLCVGPGVDLGSYARLSVSDDEPVNTVDIREVARMHVEALTRGRPGERYLIGGANQRVGKAFEGWSRRGKADPKPRDAYLVEKGQWVDTTKAQEELGLTVPQQGSDH